VLQCNRRRPIDRQTDHTTATSVAIAGFHRWVQTKGMYKTTKKNWTFLKSVQFSSVHFCRFVQAFKPTFLCCVTKVKFDPAYEFLNDFDSRPDLRSYFSATAVRVVLVRPACAEPLLSYYAISHFSIKGQCQCYGHASSCSGQVSQWRHGIDFGGRWAIACRKIFFSSGNFRPKIKTWHWKSPIVVGI